MTLRFTAQSPRRVPAAGVSRVSRQPDSQSVSKIYAKKAAIESDRNRYYELACGHFGDIEEDTVHAAWRPSRNLHYCEHCGWKPLKSKPQGRGIPQEPLF